jgi:hypothetical protein
MVGEGQAHQLTDIMFTDIVGCTALTGRDKEKALQLVRASMILK